MEAKNERKKERKKEKERQERKARGQKTETVTQTTTQNDIIKHNVNKHKLAEAAQKIYSQDSDRAKKEHKQTTAQANEPSSK